MMDLIERYVAAVRRSLPRDKAEDLAAELADELHSRKEEREEALGRPLTEEETSAMLREFGHPLVIASRYRSNQYLIGPDVFPFYLFTLKVVLSVGIALLVALSVVSQVLGGKHLLQAPFNAIGDLWSFLFLAVAVVTIVFAVLERFGFPADHLRSWTPEHLPDPSDKPHSQWEAALEVGLGIAFLLWWMGLVTIPAFPTAGGVRVEVAPIWDQFYLPILLIASVQLATNLVKWLRPRWKSLVSLLIIATSAAMLAVIAGLQRAESWVVVSGADAAEAAQLTKSVNLALQIALAAVAIVMVLQALGEIWKLARPRVQRMA